MIEDYEKQANDFLESTNTKLSCKFVKHGKHFSEDTEERDIYEITLERNTRNYVFLFGQSIENSSFKIFNDYENNKTEFKAFPEDMARLIPESRGTNRVTRFGNPINANSQFKANCFNHFGSLNGLRLVYPKEPSAYDVLCCLTKSDPETFDDFCSNYGYDSDSIKALKIYEKVCEEWKNIRMLYSDKEIEKLGEIQ